MRRLLIVLLSLGAVCALPAAAAGATTDAVMDLRGLPSGYAGVKDNVTVLRTGQGITGQVSGEIRATGNNAANNNAAVPPTVLDLFGPESAYPRGTTHDMWRAGQAARAAGEGGNALVTPWHPADANQDGLVDDPQDPVGRQQLCLSFVGFKGQVSVHKLTVLDADSDERGGSVVVVTTATGTVTVPIAAVADGSWQSVPVNSASVTQLCLNLAGSGGITGLRLTETLPDVPAVTPPPPAPPAAPKPKVCKPRTFEGTSTEWVYNEDGPERIRPLALAAANKPLAKNRRFGKCLYPNPRRHLTQWHSPDKSPKDPAAMFTMGLTGDRFIAKINRVRFTAAGEYRGATTPRAERRRKHDLSILSGDFGPRGRTPNGWHLVELDWKVTVNPVHRHPRA